MTRESERVGIRALQQHASAVVARAAAGENIEITDRGRPVARIVPLAPTTLDALVAAGQAREAELSIDELGPPLTAAPGQPTPGEALRDARRDER